MIRRRLFLTVLAGLFLALLLFPLAWDRTTTIQGKVVESARSDLDPGSPISGYSQDAYGLKFTLLTPTFGRAADGLISAPGLNSRNLIPGSPSLPYFSTYIVLPPGAKASVTVEEHDLRLSTAEIAPAPDLENPELAISDAPAQQLSDQIQLYYERDKAIYQADKIFPAVNFELSDVIYLRDLRLQKLALYPLRYNPVTRQLFQAERMQVTVDFIGYALIEGLPSSDNSDFRLESLNENILNYDQVGYWRELPARTQLPEVTLPVNKDTYKIEVNQDGIYELTYSMLHDAGMVDLNIDPHSFQMMYRGQPVAYQLVENGNGIFDNGDVIRFYGWAFDGPRLEKQFIKNNVFWLWAGSEITQTIGFTNSVTGTPLNSFQSSVNVEHDEEYLSTRTNQWPAFPNEPDAWYWDLVAFGNGESTVNYTVTLPYPAAEGPPAQFTAEITTMDQDTLDITLHEVDVAMNGQLPAATDSWYGEKNVNIAGTVPMSAVLDGPNVFQLTYTTGTLYTWFGLNRISVNYSRQFIAVNDTLSITDVGGSPRMFSVSGFSQGDSQDIFIWDLQNRLSPVAISTETFAVSGSDTTYTYTFGTDRQESTTFLIANRSSLKAPVTISQYTPPLLDPQSGGAEWVAISHHDFLGPAQRLADHRADPKYGNLSTYIVDIEDVINQYGFGLPVPAAVREYLVHAFYDWPGDKPNYVTLFGDATIDPRRIEDIWLDEQYLPTDLQFVDRWQGHIPTDLTMALIVGEDLVPDIALGRIPVSSTVAANSVIDKIIQFESNNQQWSFSWMERLLFVGDDADSAGDFCAQNNVVMENRIPDALDPVPLCLDDEKYGDPGDLRADILYQTGSDGPGATLLNYRGHGSVNVWANGGIMSTNHVSLWDNPFKPVVILTGDCLDGFFALPDRLINGTIERRQSLGEELLRAMSKGSAAHWGSSGLGLPSEHSIMIEKFYEGLFDQGLTAIGDAIAYAKIQYHLAGANPSLLYSFTLLGDPAMQLFRPELSLQKTVEQSFVKRGETVQFILSVANTGVYPSHVQVSDTLPAGLSYESHTSSMTTTLLLAGQEVGFDLQFGGEQRNQGLSRNGTGTIIITARVNSDANLGPVINSAKIVGTGLDRSPDNDNDTANIIILDDMIMLPLLKRN